MLPAYSQRAASVLLEGCECVPSEWLSEDATAVLKALMVLHRILRETSSKQRLYEKAQAFSGRAPETLNPYTYTYTYTYTYRYTDIYMRHSNSGAAHRSAACACVAFCVQGLVLTF